MHRHAVEVETGRSAQACRDSRKHVEAKEAKEETVQTFSLKKLLNFDDHAYVRRPAYRNTPSKPLPVGFVIYLPPVSSAFFSHV